MRCESLSLGGEDERYDETVECECFSENENQNHSHKNLVLLRISPHSCVSHDTDSKTGRLNHPIFTKELNPQHSPEARCAYADLSE